MRKFHGYLAVIFMFVIASPCVLNARDQGNEYQGYYANELDDKIDYAKSRIAKNLKSYSKDKSVVHLDHSYSLIIQTTDDIHAYLRNAAQQVAEIPESKNLEKLKAQVDKLEIINIRDIELPYLCEKLYEVGKLYGKNQKNKAKQCFKAIAERFTSYESEDCNRKAKSALERLQQVKR